MTCLLEWVQNYWNFSRELGVLYEMDQITQLQPRVRRLPRKNFWFMFFLGFVNAWNTTGTLFQGRDLGCGGGGSEEHRDPTFLSPFSAWVLPLPSFPFIVIWSCYYQPKCHSCLETSVAVRAAASSPCIGIHHGTAVPGHPPLLRHLERLTQVE